MKSEFKHLDLDIIRYSLVWEDSQTLFQLLDINEDDHLMIITSAGCNVLNALLKNPKQVTAVDLNPKQNRLLELKMHVIKNHDYKVYHDLLGLSGAEGVTTAFQEVATTLRAEDASSWRQYFSVHPNGILTSGKLEAYIISFYAALPHQLQQSLLKLLEFNTVEEQYKYFSQHLAQTDFKTLFIEYFDEKNLSKGRDPKLFKYAGETGGTVFYNRLESQIKQTLVKNNFYFRFFFFGPTDIPPHILPPCMQEVNYQFLRSQLSKINMVNAEAIDHLTSDRGSAYTKISLSNIFEYTSHEEFEQVMHKFSVYLEAGTEIIYWNLLNDQRPAEDDAGKMRVEEFRLASTACFYFRNVMKLSIHSIF